MWQLDDVSQGVPAKPPWWSILHRGTARLATWLNAVTTRLWQRLERVAMDTLTGHNKAWQWYVWCMAVLVTVTVVAQVVIWWGHR